jgi:hypothetical protein
VRRAMRRPAGLWLLMLLMIGCSHTPLPIPPQSIEAYSFRQAQSGVRVAVDPYFTLDRMQVAFSGGEDFSQNGLLPIQVIIENDSPGAIQIDPRAFRLLRPDGRVELALSPQDALSLIKKTMGWWAALGGGLVAGPASAYQNESRQKSLEARALKEETLSEGRSANGFVYFPISENEKSLAGNRVVFAVSGPEGRALTYEILIDGRRDLPLAVNKPETGEQPKLPVQTPLDPRNSQSPTRIEGTGGQGVIIRSPAQ